MQKFVKYIVAIIFSLLLAMGPVEDGYAQRKASKPAAAKTTKSSKKPVQGKPSAKANAKPASKPSTKKSDKAGVQKPASKPSQKPAGKPSKKKKPLSRQAYEKQQKDLQRQISDTEKLISNNNQSVRSQSRDISIREDEIRKRQALINSKQREIEAIKIEEDSLEYQIRNLEISHKATQEKYAAAMRHLYKWRSGYNELLFVLSSDDMLQAVRRVRYLHQYGDWRKEQATLLEQQRIATAEAKAALEQTRIDHENVLKDIDHERASLAAKQQQQEAQVASLQKRNKELQGELDRDRKKMAEVEKTIQRMIEEEIRKAEEARRRAEEEAKRQEEERKKSEEARKSGSSSSKTAHSGSANGSRSAGNSSSSATIRVDDSYRRLSGSFANNRGRLPYPLDANFAFVDHYNPSNGNSSIVLSTQVGAHACAIYDGTVQGCYPSNEEWTVIVQHGNYRSVYMNLKNVTVKAGQKVSVRQALGTLKTEPDGNRAELRFWIYQNASAVNPERWLKR